jgi:hypothetical protein
MLWLGDRAGYLPDAITQLWVRATGRRFEPADFPWLDGPIGDTHRIGEDFFERSAARDGCTVRAGCGLLTDASILQAADSPHRLSDAVADFYQNTGAYRIDAWSERDGLLKPFGVLLASIFSRRLEQLNVPLDNLESSRGMTSRIVEVVHPRDGVMTVAWIRTLAASEPV